ncbi:hypothetical protein AMELA_G00178080 [Ameiurus melas]|uniref:Uncharacterized protein n=1 Tax=Ameiurus melas TaxID=219545 RepID=A0A7J6ABN4_AMEME|nr:hypothetical protein AMELA_G00178080 [Ameiurus melas]
MATLARQRQNPDPFSSRSRPVLSSAADSLSPDNMHVYGQIPACEHVSRAVRHVCGPAVKPVGFPSRYGKSVERTPSRQFIATATWRPFCYSDGTLRTLAASPLLSSTYHL